MADARCSTIWSLLQKSDTPLGVPTVSRSRPKKIGASAWVKERKPGKGEPTQRWVVMVTTEGGKGGGLIGWGGRASYRLSKRTTSSSRWVSNFSRKSAGLPYWLIPRRGCPVAGSKNNALVKKSCARWYGCCPRCRRLRRISFRCGDRSGFRAGGYGGRRVIHNACPIGRAVGQSF